MSYGCIVKGCDKPDGADGFKTQTAMLNHVRMTQDQDHNQMWNRIKRKQSEETENEDQGQEETESSNNSQGTENVEVTKLQKTDKDSGDSQGSANYVDIEKVDLESLVENGVCDSLDHAVNKLTKAKENGFSEIDPETGDLN